MKNATAVRYTPAGGGRILFVRNDNLYAQTLNRTTRTLEGGPELIQQRVASSPSFYAAHFSVSRTGVVAWRPGTAGLSQVTIFDRRGKGDRHGGSSYRRPDAQARARRDTSARGIQRDRVAAGARPTWAAAVRAGRSGHAVVAGWVQAPRDKHPSGNDSRVMERSVTGQGPVRELAKPSGMWFLEDISPDGKTLLLIRGPLDTTVFSLSLDGVQKEPKSLLQTGETISHARFSPDGRWIVYTASAAGSERGGIYTGGGTYVQPYPGPGLRKQVTSRGNYPVWRKDGKEIVYLDEYQGRNYIWSVPVAARGNEFQAGTPSPLFPARLPATTFGDLNFLAVSRDGSRFYIPQAVEQAGTPTLSTSARDSVVHNSSVIGAGKCQSETLGTKARMKTGALCLPALSASRLPRFMARMRTPNSIRKKYPRTTLDKCRQIEVHHIGVTPNLNRFRIHGITAVTGQQGSCSAWEAGEFETALGVRGRVHVPRPPIGAVEPNPLTLQGTHCSLNDPKHYAGQRRAFTCHVVRARPHQLDVLNSVASLEDCVDRTRLL